MLAWPAQRVPWHIPMISSLSNIICPLNFPYQKSDYLAYVNQRLSLFRHLSLAKTALRQGGIIWHLALESFKLSAQRPSSVAGEINEHMSDPLSFTVQAGTFMENLLTDAEINVICGIYTDHTGKSTL